MSKLFLSLTFWFQEQLDQKLEQRQARETGICQVNIFLTIEMAFNATVL